ncbi:hypothetical protein J31TS4_27980 [Paenibacillus sp. J31TS4]|nr:hypothetical protein J31TS4_27980 [Paenibacillus sp. J31TS4]
MSCRHRHRKHHKKNRSLRNIKVVNKNTNNLNFDPDFVDVNRNKDQQVKED